VRIDWLTVGAQLVNFLLIVYLLKRLLYRPVLDAMSRRERRVADRLREAEARERDAEASSRQFQKQSSDLERDKARLLEQARADADKERRAQLEQARADVDEQRARWRAQLEQEWADAQDRFRIVLAGAITDAARRALADLADADLETAMARAFRRHLAEVSADDRRALGSTQDVAEIATAFEPGPDLKREIADAVREAFGPRDVRFVRAASVIGGIEVRVGGWQLSWTLAEHVRGLEDRLSEALLAAGPVTAGGAVT